MGFLRKIEKSLRPSKVIKAAQRTVSRISGQAVRTGKDVGDPLLSQAGRHEVKAQEEGFRVELKKEEELGRFFESFKGPPEIDVPPPETIIPRPENVSPRFASGFLLGLRHLRRGRRGSNVTGGRGLLSPGNVSSASLLDTLG